MLISIVLANAATRVEAQDTCRMFAHPNPHGAEMWIDSIWVLDTVNFTVEAVEALPWFEKVEDTLHFVVCIKARDGKKYSTLVRYMTTHGVVSYYVRDFEAPSSSAVPERHRLDFAYPNPAGNSISFVSSVNAHWQIVDLLGRSVLEGRATGEETSVPLGTLAEGSYTLVTSDREPRRFVVKR